MNFYKELCHYSWINNINSVMCYYKCTCSIYSHERKKYRPRIVVHIKITQFYLHWRNVYNMLLLSNHKWTVWRSNSITCIWYHSSFDTIYDEKQCSLRQSKNVYFRCKGVHIRNNQETCSTESISLTWTTVLVPL